MFEDGEESGNIDLITVKMKQGEKRKWKWKRGRKRREWVDVSQRAGRDVDAISDRILE